MGAETQRPTPSEVSQTSDMTDVVWIEVRLRLGLPMHTIVMLSASIWSDSPTIGMRKARLGGMTMEPPAGDGLRERLHRALDAACDGMDI